MKPTVAHLLLTLCLSPLVIAQSETQAAEQTPEPTVTVHKVRPGDCFNKIARANGCSIADLAALNGLQTDAVLQIDQELKIPAPTTANSAETTTVTSEDTTTSTAAESPSHTVKAGDTFSKIAKLHDVSVDSLIAANPTVKPTAMRLGQKIILPVADKAAEQTAPEESNTESANSQANEESSASSEANDESASATETNNTEADAQATQDGSTASPEANGTDQQNTPPDTPEAPDGTANDADGGNVNDTNDQNANDQNDGNVNDSSMTFTRSSARSIATEREMTYEELAAQYGTRTERLNSLNGLDLQPSTILAKGADLLVPVGMSN
ncbi:MAG: hypothetical protein RLZ22_1285 [Verrucomicrobiota bacterium]|jgi:LysM repeat protein